jgi:exopolysaccharide biosynthesis protein
MDVKKLVENSVTLLIQNPDEFLNKFTPEDFNNKITITELKKLLGNANRIGEKSGAGEVYKPKDAPIIIKTTASCPKGDTRTLIKTLCEIAENGDIVYHIPDTYSGKTLIYASNFLIENLIGVLLSNDMKNYTPAFMKIYGFQYDSTDIRKMMYTVAEPLINSDEYIRSDDDFLHYVFQTVRGLNVAQKIGRYVHYDLHTDNIMARKKKEEISITPLSNGEFLYSYFDFDPVIIDYGFNRYETKDSILASRGKIVTGMDVMDNYFYNPYYDLYTFLIRCEDRQYKKLYKNWMDQDEKLTGDLLKRFINVPGTVKNSESFVDRFIARVKYNWWRPNPEMLTTEISEHTWHRVLNTDEFLVQLVSKIKSTRATPFPGVPRTASEKSELLKYIKKNKFWISKQIIKFPGENIKVYDKLSSDKIMSSANYQYRSLDSLPGKVSEYKETFAIGGDKIIDISSKSSLPGAVNDNVYKYHRSLPESMYKERTFDISVDTPWIHLAIIDQKIGRDNGYKFRFDCCRVDMRNYFQTETIKSGIAINAGFFKLKEDFAPVGYFKTDNYVSKNSIPKNYEKYYGIIGIDKEGMLRVDKPKYADEYQRVVTSGPLLVWDFEKQITEDMLSTELNSDNNFLWQCRKSVDSDANTASRVFKDGLNNCDQIQPGELSHASNPNPRSAIFVTREGKVGMLYVEGRDQKGPGLDLSQLADLCKYHGARFAINLDGGRSSQMLWKKQGQEIIYQTNSFNTNSYPVGSIISYIKQ